MVVVMQNWPESAFKPARQVVWQVWIVLEHWMGGKLFHCE